MKQYLLAFACLVACAVSGAELARWDFDEAGGSFSEDAVQGVEAVLSPTAAWATGTFGKALALDGRGASVRVGTVPGWAGRKSFTVSLRAFWKNGGRGHYPNVLTTDGWGTGPSFMLFVSDGALSFRYGDKADGIWREKSLPVLAKIPKGRWVHLAVTFDCPNLMVYVDGKAVAKATWEHGLAGAGGFTLGKWSGDASHDGFLDEFCLYDAALTMKAVARLADDENYRPVEGYNDDGTGGIAKTRIVGQDYPAVATVAGDRLTAVFDAGGRLKSLKAEGSDRELVGTVVPFVEVVRRDGTRVFARKLRKATDGALVFALAGNAGDVTLVPKAAGGGIVFTIKSVTAKDAEKVSFVRVSPACRKHQGSFVNGCSDETHAVVLRGFELKTESILKNGLLAVTAESGFGLTGWRAGLAAARRGEILERLKAMTVEAGVPRTDAGGAWSLGSEGARQSYLFATVLPNTTDWWIDLAERGGFSILHFTSDWSTGYGHYALRPEYYPNGIADMKACVDRIHAAGLKTGIHTLSACIDPKDPWITPRCSTNLYADAKYTLAKALGEDDDEVVVNERPIEKHDLVFTYSSNGNVLRVGHELIQYSGVRREKPYAFTGLKRGAFKTKVSDHAVGERCDYLHQRYVAFYPDPDSPLADELTACLAKTYNECGHDEFYFDGSEGMGSRYGVDTMRWKIAAALDKKPGAPSIEASCRFANNWWFQSRTGTTDHPVWAAKRFHDIHVRDALDVRQAEFLEPQMGWWQSRQAKPTSRGHFLDEMEYFAAKNAGIDAAMSLQGIHFGSVTYGFLGQLTVLGWYERLRLARAFDPVVQKALAKPGTEYRLRQDDDGRWIVRQVGFVNFRSVSPDTHEKTFVRPVATPLAMRIEALYGAGDYDCAEAQPILTPTEAAVAALDSAKGVRISRRGERDAQHGETTVLTVENASAPQKGSWARLQHRIPLPYLDLDGKSAFGLWVRGDGSGALLKLQVTTGREYTETFSDHDVRLDFTGWRYFSFLARERDVADYHRYVWPYGEDYYAIYRYALDTKHIGEVSLYLNDIPAGKRVEVAVSAVKALPINKDVTVSDVSVAINGEELKLPFTELKGGDYVELEDGRWTRFTELGEPLETAIAERTPSFGAGENRCRVTAHDPDSRIEATFISLGKPRTALKEGFDCAAAKPLAVEMMRPVKYAPTKGFDGALTVPVRSGESARLQLMVTGPVRHLTLERKRFFGTDRWAFPVDLPAGERLVCRDGRTWQRMSVNNDTVLSEGVLEDPLPEIDGTVRFAVTSSAPAEADARIDIVKRYGAR